MALSFARDEIIWLLRHADNIQKKSTDDFIDKYANIFTHIYLQSSHMLTLVQVELFVDDVLCFADT